MTNPVVASAEDRARLYDAPLERTVSWVMWPVDGFTDEVRPIDLEVTMVTRPAAGPVRDVIVNLSGALVFDDLIPGNYTVRLRPRGADADRFFELEHSTTIAAVGPKEDVLRFWPRPAYSFPDWAAIVRGRLTVAGQPYSGATIEQFMAGPITDEIQGQLDRRRTQTTALGEFALSPYTWVPLPSTMFAPPPLTEVSIRVTYGSSDAPKTLEDTFSINPGTQTYRNLTAME